MSMRPFTPKESLENEQKFSKLKRSGKFLKNEQLFVAIRDKKKCEEKIREIEKYLEQGADINAIDRRNNNNTSLHVAVLMHDVEIVNALLYRGAVIDAKNADGETPIDIAKRLQCQSIIDILEARTAPHHMTSVSTPQIETRINFNQHNESEKNSPAEVTKRDGAQELLGHIDQLKLLMLFLKRGLDKKYSFRLATENKESMKFDDLFFEITNKYGEKEYRLLHYKHRTDKCKSIAFDNLLSLSNCDYSLVQYFFSYLDLKKNLINKGSIRDVTICTNIDFELDGFNTLKDMRISDIVKTIDNFDDILYFESTASVTGKRYQFKKEIIPLLKPSLLKYNLTELARQLANCVVKNKVIDHHNELFSAYHIILAEEVIDTKNKIFYEKFVNKSELSEEAELFRESFEKILCEKLPKLCCFRNINKLIVESKPCFKLSKYFGYSKINQNWPEKSKDIEELAKILIHNILTAKIINRKGVFKLYHTVLAEEIIDIKEYKFIDQFVIGEGLSEDAKKFRKALEIESELQGAITLKEINDTVNDNNNIKGLVLNLSEQFGKEGKDKIKTWNKEKLPIDTIPGKEIKYRYQENLNLDETNRTVENNLNFLDKPADDNKAKKNWLSNYVSDENINDFLDHLVFAVNLPNEDELVKIIENYVDQDLNFGARYYVYKELFVKMLVWLNGKGEEFISYEDGKSLFEDIKNNISELELTAVSMEYEFKIKKYDIEFKESFDSKLCNFLKLSETNIFNVITKEITLSAIKVYGILTSIPEYKYHYNYIFMKLNSVLRQQNHVERALKITKNVLVITCKTASKDIQEQYTQLFNIMKSSNSKNIILISHQNDSIAQKFKVDTFFKYKYNEVIDRSIKFSDLSSDSKIKLLRTSSVIFQGKEINLSKLITVEDANDLIEPEVLFMLISNVDVKIGNTYSELGAMDHYFMNRKLYSCENIEENFKKEFYFTYNSKNIKTSDLKEHQDIVLISDSVEQFEELLSEYEKHNIHWIMKEDEELIWMDTRYKNYNIREFYTSSVSQKNCKKNIELFLSKQNTKNQGKNITDITDDVVIFSADPGMGKSIMLAYLAQQSKELNSLLWVEKIDLRYHTRKLESFTLPINRMEVIDYLSDVIGLKTQLEKGLFKLRINKHGQITLLFDGFDEISPMYKEIVLKLLHVLRSTKVERLWITIRPHIKNEIEDKLGALSYTLKPLSIKEQQIFLKKFYCQKFDICYTNEKCLGYYSDEIVDVFSELVNKDIKLALYMSNYKLYKFRFKFKDKSYVREIFKLVREVKKFISNSPTKYDPKYILQLIGRKPSPDKRLNDYTNKLLETMSTSIHDVSLLFTGIPLYLRMLAEMFQDNFKDFCDSEQDKLDFSEVFHRVNFVHEVFLQKVKSFLENK